MSRKYYPKGKKMKTEENDLLTLAEAARLLRLKISTLRAWRLQRKIAFCKIGGRVVIRRVDIERFISAGLIPAKARAEKKAA
jgi:excisionase family DNA binding protein